MPDQASPSTWSRFINSPLGIAGAFLLLAALLQVGLVPEGTPTEEGGRFLLALIALASVAVLAYREHGEPALQPATAHD